MAEEQSIVPSQFKKFLARFSPSQKIFIAAVIIMTVIGVFLVVNMAGSFTYGTLFTNLSPKDSGMILEQLKAKKIPYEVAGGGSVIKVPDDKVDELRIELAASGLPEGSGIGFEIFDKTNLTTTDFVQNINYIRAVEGELARSISQLKEVITAKVHITPAKRSVFIDDQEPAKASVVLKLTPGATVSGSNIIPAILHLTAQSVEGLKPENIAIVDIYGTLLSKPSDDSEDAVDDSQLTYQKTMENNYTRKIVNLLEPIVGPGRVRANVKLTLDFDKVEMVEESVDPDRIAKVSEKTETSSSTGGARSGGVPGVNSNVVQGSSGQTESTFTPAKSKTENSLINYEISKKVTQTKKPVGDVKRLSAAVVVDDNTQVQLVDGQIQKEVKKRSADELEALKRLVQAAVGYNSERGDIVEVVNLAFDTSVVTETDFNQKKQENRELIDSIIKYGSIALGVLFVFFFILRPIFKKMSDIFKNIGKTKQEEIEIPRIDSEKVAALQDARDDLEIEKELMEQYKVPKASKKMDIIRQKVVEFAEENIDETASLVKSFLIED